MTSTSAEKAVKKMYSDMLADNAKVFCRCVLEQTDKDGVIHVASLVWYKYIYVLYCLHFFLYIFLCKHT